MNQEAFDRLLSAARALLEAREDQMITRLEWEALAEAAAAASNFSERSNPVSTGKPRVGHENL